MISETGSASPMETLEIEMRRNFTIVFLEMSVCA